MIKRYFFFNKADAIKTCQKFVVEARYNCNVIDVQA